MQIKLHQTKEPKTSAKTSQLSSMNSSMIHIKKEDSKHAKPSTHISLQSTHLHNSAKKTNK
jgi:hypothetical protein